MNYAALQKSVLFQGVPENALREELALVPYRIKAFDKDTVIFRLMDPAVLVGVILRGRVEAQKSFPNGSQINVTVRGVGEMIGPAAVFSRRKVYPCDIVALESTEILLLGKQELLLLMQRNVRVLENLTAEIATSTYMLQQRLELLSYSGIAQKAAFWLLIQSRQSGKRTVRIPDSISKWALRMNVSRPSLHRELKRLSDNGIIDYAPPLITICNEKALQDVLSR